MSFNRYIISTSKLVYTFYSTQIKPNNNLLQPFNFLTPFTNMPKQYQTCTTPSSELVAATTARLPSIENPVVLSVEGNIGAGKSTLLNVLLKHFGEENIEVLTEPVDRWTNCDGHNLLEALYADPKRYAYTFQSYAFITRLMEQQKPQKKPIRILERSALSDYCFAQNCHQAGQMNDLEFAAYKQWWSFFSKSMAGGPQGVLYLRASPETCHKRMCIRNRSEEQGVPLEYLKQLHEKHEQWLPPNASITKSNNKPFVVLNADIEFETDEDAQKKIIDSVVTLLHKIVKNKK